MAFILYEFKYHVLGGVFLSKAKRLRLKDPVFLDVLIYPNEHYLSKKFPYWV